MNSNMRQRSDWRRSKTNKNLIKGLLILLLTLCLTACSDNTGDGKSEQPTPDVSNSKTAFNEQPTVPSPDRPDSSLGGTYWTAVKHESYNEAFGRTEVSQMPTERWWADLFLNEDGTAQFREVLGDSFQDYLGDATWWLGVDNTLRLASVDDGGSNEMNGRIEDECIILESVYGDRFYFEKAERPGPGGELCIANLHGTWKMAKSVVEGREYSAREEGIASILFFEARWSEAIGGHELRADYYFADFLDTEEPIYRQELELRIELLDKPLFHGFSNEIWSIRLFNENTGAELFLALADSDTLYLQEHYKTDGASEIRTAIYKRAESILPDSVQEALYDEPEDSLIFYWSSPPDDVYTELEALPVTKLEQEGLDKLLLVGCWYETQIRFCTGEPVWDDNGNLLEWVTDEILYDETIKINEPKWFSLTIPEGVPNICLHVKRPWDDFWYLWPIADTDIYLNGDWIFLTP